MSGPAPGSQCHVCRHPDVALINEALAKGLSGRKVALQFGLGKDSILRHVAARHPGVPGLERGSRPPREHDGSELSSLEVMREQLESEMEDRVRSDTARELRQVHQRIAELTGNDRPKSVGVVDVEGLTEQVAAWFKALEPFPEAREAMLAVTPAGLLP